MWQATRDTKSFRKFQTMCSSSDNEWNSPSMCYRKAETKGKRSNKGDWRRMPPESSSPTDATMVLWTSTHYNWDYLLNANIPFKTIGSERAESFYTSVQFSSVAQFWLSLCDPRNRSMQASLSITNSWSLLKLMSIGSVMPPNHLILCCLPLFPPSIFPSIRVFSNESVLCIRCPEYWSFSISPYNEYSGLISFRMDWLDLLAVQGTLKSLLQHHSSSILQCSAFFIVQLSHPILTFFIALFLSNMQYVFVICLTYAP